MSSIQTSGIRRRYCKLALIIEENRSNSRYAEGYVSGYLEHGVNVNATFINGITPLDLARKSGNDILVDMLTITIEEQRANLIRRYSGKDRDGNVRDMGMSSWRGG